MSHPRSPSTRSSAPKKWWQRLYDWMIYDDKSKWLEDMRGSLSLTTSIIATITFQSALNPPGGVVQISFNELDNLLNCSSDVSPNWSSNSNLPCPGKAILALVEPDAYQRFLVYNTICFIASLSVCFLLVSGLNLNHAFTTWLLLIGMWITLTTLAGAYSLSAVMVTPGIDGCIINRLLVKFLLAWPLFVAAVGFPLLIRFIAWVVKCIKSCHSRCATSTN